MLARLADHVQLDLLAENIVGDTYRRRLCNRRNGARHPLDLVRRDVLAAAPDALLLPTAEVVVALLVEPAQVACVEPKVAVAGESLLRHFVVAAEHQEG